MRIVSFVQDNAAFLAAGFLLAFSSSYGQTFFISIFAGEIRETFDLSHGEWGGLYTLSTTASALVMVWAGLLADRFRVRVLCIGAGIGLAVACLAMAAVPNWIALVFVIFALRFTGQGMMSQLAAVAMARWFVASRGRALSISSLGLAMGQAVLPLAFVAAMTVIDWRWTWVIAAGLMMATLPVIVRLLRLERTPQALAADDATSTAGMAGQHWTRGQAMRHWLFWCLVPIVLGPPAWGTALFFQQVHLSEVKGWTLIEFVSLIPIYTAASVTMTLGSGWAIDRFGAVRLMPIFALPWIVGFTILAGSGSLLVGGIGMVLIGLGAGAQGTLMTSFWAEIYGTRHLGAIKALAVALMVFGSAIGPGVTGVLIDEGFDFPVQMYGIAVYFGISGLLCTAAVLRVLPTLPRAPKVDVVGS